MELVVFAALHFQLDARPEGGQTADGRPPLQILLDLIKTKQEPAQQPIRNNTNTHSSPGLPHISVSPSMTRYLSHLSGTMQGNDATCGYELSNIVVELLTEYQEKEATPVNSDTAVTTTMMIIRNEVMLNPNIHEHSLRILAKKHFINEKTLSRAFTKAFGIKISDFILTQVMQRAKYLLENSKRTVGDIAEELGYSNNYNFARTFKNVYGIYPMECRKNHTAASQTTY